MMVLSIVLPFKKNTYSHINVYIHIIVNKCMQMYVYICNVNYGDDYETALFTKLTMML